MWPPQDEASTSGARHKAALDVNDQQPTCYPIALEVRNEPGGGVHVARITGHNFRQALCHAKPLKRTYRLCANGVWHECAENENQ